MIKKDCFAINSNYKGCTALNCLVCGRGDCKFYKTFEEAQTSTERAANRIKSKGLIVGKRFDNEGNAFIGAYPAMMI